MNKATAYPTPHAKFIYQLSNLVSKYTKLTIVVNSDETGFSSESDYERKSGILEVKGERSQNIIQVSFKLTSGIRDAKVSIDRLFTKLSELGDNVNILTPVTEINHSVISLWVMMAIENETLDFNVVNSIMLDMETINKLAIFIQDELPEVEDEDSIYEVYREISDFIAPVFPLNSKQSYDNENYKNWLAETTELISSKLPVAIVCENIIQEEYILAAIAGKLKKKGMTIGQLQVATLNVKSILDIAKKAPGILWLRSSSLAIGTNIYEISNDVQNVLQQMRNQGYRVIFSGSYAEHQGVFQGGQGGVSDPQLPVVRHLPVKIPMKYLLAHKLEQEVKQIGGLPKTIKKELFSRIYEAQKGRDYADQMRSLTAITNYELVNYKQGDTYSPENTKAFSGQVIRMQETFSGIENKPSIERAVSVQRNFLKGLTTNSMYEFLTGRLLAQDKALKTLTKRLQEEALLRPLYQPIRYCAQGTPATGKSESAKLLAEALGIPFINIDAAGMPDFYTASSQLLGSGRGLVGSNKSGRLEQAAKCNRGAVLEISDLDHANSHVRASLSDLFLQVLETGQAQSAMGEMFSCANLIFAFTINLPDGKDEILRKPGVGFNNYPTESSIRKDVEKEVKYMFSSAFLSRIGNPVLFETLKGKDLGLISEQVILSSIFEAAKRLDFKISELEIKKNTGMAIIKSIEDINTFGARILIDRTRSILAEAILEKWNKGELEEPGKLVIFADESGKLILKKENKPGGTDAEKSV
ncbi:MAG: AAA family ATPase [Candidatus Stygibacter australis]|nr:AAA family ATPase [Candidatus Stygibacter australis]MDP8323252.1 AAA family ATPase [Candidatus Stygibacter australis]